MVPSVSATSCAVRSARSSRSCWRRSPAAANSRGALAAYLAPPRAASRIAVSPRLTRSLGLLTGLCLQSLLFPLRRAHAEREPLPCLEHARLAEVDRVEDAEDLADLLALRRHRVAAGAGVAATGVAEAVHGPRPAGQRVTAAAARTCQASASSGSTSGMAMQVRRGVFR